jgi:UDP-N-acetylglucosamine 2-epimerase (non-hydrolysing)
MECSFSIRNSKSEMPLKSANIVGARPNFMKIAPIHRLMQRDSAFDPVLIHTGQHYDKNMSDAFFNDLGLPEPDRYLGVGSGTQSVQTAGLLVAIEKALLEIEPDLVLVVGDVNSTLAAALVAAKLRIPLAHVEAGLRSFDRSMPEEVNRVVTDRLSDLLFVTEESGMKNLKNEGSPESAVHFTGNVMIDSLVRFLDTIKDRPAPAEFAPFLNRGFILTTLHRPSNVDDRDSLAKILDALEGLLELMPVVFPAHPRTRKNIESFGLKDRLARMKGLFILEPAGYIDFLQLLTRARLVLTDSGGIQEETTFLGIPCLTLRENTERPVTIALGTNRLVPLDAETIAETARLSLNGPKTHSIPPLWDGHAAERIVAILKGLRG